MLYKKAVFQKRYFRSQCQGDEGGAYLGGGGLLEGALIRGAVIREGRSVQNVSKGARLIEGRRLFEGGA